MFNVNNFSFLIILNLSYYYHLHNLVNHLSKH